MDSFFHHDDKHNHSFDESSFQFGAIYCCREMKEKGKKLVRKSLPVVSLSFKLQPNMRTMSKKLLKWYTYIKLREVERRKEER